MRILCSSCLLASAFCLAMAPASGAAQKPPSKAPAANPPAFKKKAPEIVLPVTILDKHGNLVTNLTAADFTLTEDGRTQIIASFSTQSGLPFWLGLLVDTSRPVEPAIDKERKAAEKFVDRMLPADPKQAKPDNQAFLIHFDSEVELLRDFTNSREKLELELEQMGPTETEHNNPQGPETQDDSGNRGGGGNRPAHGGTQLYDAVYLASNDLMKPKAGRKALIVFSDGVDRSSKETQSDAIDAAERAGAVVYTIYFRGGEDRTSRFPGLGRRGGMGGGYPGGGYPGGGYPGGGYPGGGSAPQPAPTDGKKVMQDIANRTGGRFFEAKRSTDLDEIYNRIAQELHGQYILTYTSDQTNDDGGYRKIVLKPKKDGLTVITRQGYYPPGDDSR